MRCRLLGQTGLRVSELFLGAMRFGEGGGARRQTSAAACSTCTPTPAATSSIQRSITAGVRARAFSASFSKATATAFVVVTKYTISRDGGDPNAAGHRPRNPLGDPHHRTHLLQTARLNSWPLAHECGRSSLS